MVSLASSRVRCGAQGFSKQQRDSGLWLIAKRLEPNRFVWPPIVDGAMTLTATQFSLLVEATDWRRTIAPTPTKQLVLV
jgi:transposase